LIDPVAAAHNRAERQKIWGFLVPAGENGRLAPY
jgi:hypothetical protein